MYSPKKNNFYNFLQLPQKSATDLANHVLQRKGKASSSDDDMSICTLQAAKP